MIREFDYSFRKTSLSFFADQVGPLALQTLHMVTLETHLVVGFVTPFTFESNGIQKVFVIAYETLFIVAFFTIWVQKEGIYRITRS